MSEEIWKPVPGFDGIYEVSNYGRVRSLDRTLSVMRAGEKRTYFWRGRVLFATVGSHGYKQVTLSVNGEKAPFNVHVLVAEVFIGPNPGGLYVLHRDGDRSNCRATNLYYGTQSENLEDARRHGNLRLGEDNPGAKLTEIEVRAIKRSRGNQYDLADQFGVSQACISAIKTGKTWAEVA